MPSPGTPEFLGWEKSWEAIAKALDRLHFLASVIRKASAKRLEEDLLKFMSDEDIRFQDFAVSFVRKEFPKARQSLTDHIGTCIATRRRALLRRNRHAEKISQRRAPSAPSVEPTLHKTLNIEVQSPDILQGVDRDRPQAASQAHNLPSGATRASSIRVALPPRHILERKSQFTTASSGWGRQDNVTASEYPPSPRLRESEGKLSDARIPCPYCRESLSVECTKRNGKNKLWTYV